jgi:primosomal protein N' (replication factor Y)
VPAGLRCHYCDRVTAVPERCAHVAEGTTTPCGGTLVLEGVGTERLEETLTKAFPTARVARLDRDAASGKDVEAVLARMRRREIDLLVGTQMVAKGHDLPHVTLVGVIAADAALSMPDFRAAERTFHLLVQVAGRAGRADLPGRVLLQTRAPEHPAVRFAARHDVEAFLRAELDDRHELSYPPFARLVLVRLDGKDDRETAEAARILARAAAETDAGKSGKLDVLGPTTAPVHRARDRFRWRVLLRGERAEVRAGALAVRQAMVSLPRAVRVVIDVDPVAMM